MGERGILGWLDVGLCCEGILIRLISSDVSIECFLVCLHHACGLIVVIFSNSIALLDLEVLSFKLRSCSVLVLPTLSWQVSTSLSLFFGCQQ
jgi:hypothetical protein